MNKQDILFRVLALLYYESNSETPDNNSYTLITEVLSYINVESDFGMRKHGDNVAFLKSMVSSIISKSLLRLAISDLSQPVAIQYAGDEIIVKAFMDSLDSTLDKDTIDSNVSRLRSQLIKFKSSEAVTRLITTASMDMNMARGKIANLAAFVDKLRNGLDSINLDDKSVDDSILTEIDIDNDPELLTKSADDMLDNVSGISKYITGYKLLNETTQGGFSRGEFVTLAALQHQNKSGLTVSLFLHMLLHNKPIINEGEEGKKHLMLFMSFEDDFKLTLKTIFEYLYMHEFGKYPNIKEFKSSNIGDIIRNKLTHNGWSVKFIKANPSEWNYRKIIRKTTEYEKAGYVVHGLFTDYLAMVPTTGCITNGPTGTDLRDLFRRIRNHYSAKNTLFFTPHQVSSDAKRLLRGGGIPHSTFVQELVGNGYYSGSTQLDQEIDLELLAHIAQIDSLYYQTIGRGKHRGSTHIPSDKKFLLLPFPELGPIIGDVDRDITIGYRNVRSINTRSIDGFDF